MYEIVSFNNELLCLFPACPCHNRSTAEYFVEHPDMADFEDCSENRGQAPFYVIKSIGEN